MSILDDLTNDAERHIESLLDRAIGTIMDRIDALVSGHRFQFDGEVRTATEFSETGMNGQENVIRFNVGVEARKK